MHNGKEFNEDLGLKWYDYGARYYDPAIGRWNAVDPLAEKYAHECPYLYVGANPVLFTDPDGKEKIIGLDKNKKADRTIIAGAEKYQDDNAIHIFGHGSQRGMTLTMDGKEYSIRSARKLEAYLSKHSETWQNRKEGDSFTCY